jgi:hypothetical protein
MATSSSWAVTWSLLVRIKERDAGVDELHLVSENAGYNVPPAIAWRLLRLTGRGSQL